MGGALVYVLVLELAADAEDNRLLVVIEEDDVEDKEEEEEDDGVEGGVGVVAANEAVEGVV